MIKIDGFYIYSIGYSLHPLADMRAGQPYDNWYIPVLVARGHLEALLQRSVFKLKASVAAGNKLMAALKQFDNRETVEGNIEIWEAYGVTNALSEFEHVLTAEFGLLNIYLIEKVRGYDTSDLIERGWVLFPESLLTKARDAWPDIASATRAIVFELPTAAAFHLHRATETVLHKYFDAVSGGAPRPVNRNVGDYLSLMRDKKWGDEKVLSALKDLKDLHRNPQIHPEESLEDVDEALALLGSVHAAIVLMLKAIPDPAPTPPPTAGEAPSVVE